MKTITTQLKSKKNVLVFLAIILVCGIVLGVYFGMEAKDTMQNTLTNYALNMKENVIHFALPHFTMLSLLFVLSFIGLGIPAAIAYLFYEGLSIGFCGSIFSIIFGFKGFIYIILFFIITKIPFLLIFHFFFNKILAITKSILSWVIYKQNKKDYIINLAIGCLILIMILFLYDLFLDLIGINLIKMLSFLLT